MRVTAVYYFTKAELASRLKCHPATIMRYVKKGLLPAPVKFGSGACPCRFPGTETELALEKLNATRHQPVEPAA
jgi:hypothetical protein